MRVGRHRRAAVVLAMAAAAVSVVLGWVTSTRLFVVGGTMPVPIWGPAIGGATMAAVLGVCVLGILFAPGRRWRTAAVVVWLAALAVLTHRVVDGQDQTASSDQWFGLGLAGLGVGRETDPAPARCTIGPVSALCITRRARVLRTPTLVPFAPMVDGTDGADRLAAG